MISFIELEVHFFSEGTLLASLNRQGCYISWPSNPGSISFPLTGFSPWRFHSPHFQTLGQICRLERGRIVASNILSSWIKRTPPTLICLLTFVNFLPSYWLEMRITGQRRRRVGEAGKGRLAKCMGSSRSSQAGSMVSCPCPHPGLPGRGQVWCSQKTTPWETSAWAHIPISPLKSCVAWAHFFAFPETEFSQLRNGNKPLGYRVKWENGHDVIDTEMET